MKIAKLRCCKKSSVLQYIFVYVLFPHFSYYPILSKYIRVFQQSFLRILKVHVAIAKHQYCSSIDKSWAVTEMAAQSYISWVFALFIALFLSNILRRSPKSHTLLKTIFFGYSFVAAVTIWVTLQPHWCIRHKEYFNSDKMPDVSLTLCILNSLLYGSPFCVIYTSYKLSKMVWFFGPPCTFHLIDFSAPLLRIEQSAWTALATTGHHLQTI